MSSKCSQHLKRFVCFLLAPYCTSDGKPLPPCQSFCEKVKRDCANESDHWLANLNCAKFPILSRKRLCFGDPQTTMDCVGPHSRPCTGKKYHLSTTLFVCLIVCLLDYLFTFTLLAYFSYFLCVLDYLFSSLSTCLLVYLLVYFFTCLVAYLFTCLQFLFNSAVISSTFPIILKCSPPATRFVIDEVTINLYNGTRILVSPTSDVLRECNGNSRRVNGRYECQFSVQYSKYGIGMQAVNTVTVKYHCRKT